MTAEAPARGVPISHINNATISSTEERGIARSLVRVLGTTRNSKEGQSAKGDDAHECMQQASKDRWRTDQIAAPGDSIAMRGAVP